MSMNVNFQYPRQVEDVASVKAAVKSFDKEMRKMMMLMKEVGNTLEGVSKSFAALTSLNLADDKEVRSYVDSFREQIVKMKEGAPFQDYNRLVHEEVLAPVNELKSAVKETEAAMQKRERSYKSYLKAKARVDKTERAYAQKSKVLEDSKSYPKERAARENNLTAFHERDEGFQATFKGFVSKVQAVTKSAMHRYLQLNAGYMASVIDALTNTDPSIEEHVELYRRQLYADRRTELAHRKKEVEQEFENSLANLNSGAGDSVDTARQSYRLHPTSADHSAVLADTPATKASKAPAAGRHPQAQLTRSPDLDGSALRVREDLKASEGVKSVGSGPPVAAVQPVALPTANKSNVSTAAAARRASREEPTDIDMQEKAAAAAEVEKRLDEVASLIPPEKQPEARHTVFDADNEDDDDIDGGESYFGSVSQVNEAQQLQQQRLRAAALLGTSEAIHRGHVDAASDGTQPVQAPRPVYRFAPSTVAGASSVQTGYMAAQDTKLSAAFQEGLEESKDA